MLDLEHEVTLHTADSSMSTADVICVGEDQQLEQYNKADKVVISAANCAPST